MSQLSFFGADTMPPAPADLSGLLAAHGRAGPTDGSASGCGENAVAPDGDGDRDDDARGGASSHATTVSASAASSTAPVRNRSPRLSRPRGAGV